MVTVPTGKDAVRLTFAWKVGIFVEGTKKLPLGPRTVVVMRSHLEHLIRASFLQSLRTALLPASVMTAQTVMIFSAAATSEADSAQGKNAAFLTAYWRVCRQIPADLMKQSPRSDRGSARAMRPATLPKVPS